MIINPLSKKKKNTKISLWQTIPIFVVAKLKNMLMEDIFSTMKRGKFSFKKQKNNNIKFELEINLMHFFEVQTLTIQ